MNPRHRVVLTYLANNGPAFGLDMAKAGVASRGAIYVHLMELQRDGLVEYKKESGPTGLLRHIYNITDKGREALL